MSSNEDYSNYDDYSGRKKVKMMTKYIEREISQLYEKLITHSRDNLFEDLQLYVDENGHRDYITFGGEIDSTITNVLDFIRDYLEEENASL